MVYAADYLAGSIYRGSRGGSWIQRYRDGAMGTFFATDGSRRVQVERSTGPATNWMGLRQFTGELGMYQFTDTSPPAGRAYYRLKGL